MRRVLVFALVFGLGLGLLALLVHLRGREEGPRPAPPPTQAGEPGEQPMVPIPAEGQESGEETLIRISGRAEWSRFDPEDPTAEHPLYKLVVDDVRFVGEGLHELSGITLDLYDALTGEVRATLTAKGGRARIEEERGRPRPAGPVLLTDVVLTVLTGGPFAPLTLDVPRLDAHLEERVFRSEDRVTLRGTGLEAESRGIELRELEGVLRLLREGEVDLVLEDGTRAQLEATGEGEIVLRRFGDDALAPREARIEVEDGALLVLEGGETLRSESERLVVSGRVVQGVERERFVLESATASGGADLRRVADTFTGEVAELEFDAEGRPAQAILSGAPRAAVWVDAALEGREQARRVRIELSGPGPLTLRFHRPGEPAAPAAERRPGGFELANGGEIRVPALDLVVTATRRIGGDADPELDLGHVELEGDVVALFDGKEFQGPSLTLDFSRDASRGEGGQSLIEGWSPGPSRLTGTDARGNPFEVIAGGEARWLLRRGELEVPLARQAKLRAEGPAGFEAEAGLLRDFRQAAQSFVAEEGVVYRSPRGEASATRVVARGPEDVEFQGRAEERAVVDLAADPERGLESGTLRAVTIEREGLRVEAQGAVGLELAAREGRHELACDWLELTTPEPLEGAPELPRAFRVRARGVERAELAGSFGRAGMSGAELELEGRFLPREEGAAPDAPPPAELDRLELRGDVHVDFEDEARFTGEGERFVWTPADGGRLEGSPAERARAWGRLSARELPYRMSAEWIGFDEERLRAQWPQIVLDEALPDPSTGAQAVLIGASSEWMSADAEGVLFSGVAHLVGRLSSGRDWKLNAGAVQLFLETGEAAQPGPAGVLRQVVAWDGFAVDVGEDLRATGDLLDADFETMHMEGRPARLELLGFAWESSSIEYQLADTLVSTDQGTLSSVAGGELEGWTLRYESLRPFETPDSTILAVRNPIFSNPQRSEEVRADWALFWVDRDRWRARTEDWLRPAAEEELRSEEIEEAPPEVQQKTPSIFGRFETGRISKLLTEVYIEGNVEYTRAGRRMARVEALYLDMIDGHGWLQDAEVLFDFDVSGQPATLVARAEWMRHSADGSLQADNAIATTCTFAEPHFYVRTRDLRLTPSTEEDVTWRVSLRKNSLKFDNGLGLPLPGFSYDSDQEGKPIFDRLVFGNSARFGSFVEATVNGSLGAAGDAVAKVAGSTPDDVEGRVRYRASFLGLRGFLLGVGVEAKVEDRFWMNVYADGIPDGAEDRGMVRVDPDDRSTLRYFLRGRARYMLTGREWLDFALATQSDPGAQSEFFEGEFLEYEQKDNFVHWRKAEDGDYKSVTARFRLDEFRNYVSELPAGVLYDGAEPVSTLGGYPLLYGSNTDWGLLRRELGTSDVRSPFDPYFDDDAGDVDILRLDTAHRVELPIPLDLAGFTVSPFATARGTAWSETVDEDGGAARADLLIGAEASSTFVRTSSSGRVHSLTPTLGLRTDVVGADTGEQPIRIDQVEDPREGRFVDVGLRSRWWTIGTEEQLTIDLRSTHGYDVEGGAPDGWQGLAALGELVTRIGDVPVVVNHDGRYDIDDGRTLFTRSRLGFAPLPPVGVELGFGTGRDRTGERLYEAATAGARWRATEKWEFEGRQTIDLLGDSNLSTAFLLRRYGHDVVFELEISTREAEGTSFSIGVRPALGFRRARLGLIERWMVDNY